MSVATVNSLNACNSHYEDCRVKKQKKFTYPENGLFPVIYKPNQENVQQFGCWRWWVMSSLVPPASQPTHPRTSHCPIFKYSSLSCRVFTVKYGLWCFLAALKTP